MHDGMTIEDLIGIAEAVAKRNGVKEPTEIDWQRVLGDRPKDEDDAAAERTQSWARAVSRISCSTKSRRPQCEQGADMTVNIYPFNTRIALLMLFCVILLRGATAQAQKGKYVCDEAQPESMCNAANTCGSDSSPCTIDITRSGNSAKVKPGISNATSNQFFCVKAGTEVVWMSSNKNNGFMVSFGTDSPFDPDDPIMGGGKKRVRTKASTPGCYKYDAGAFRSGTIYGMSGGSKPELVILP
jgi:hypothetical protein